jgi:hypothetical protein
MSVVEDWTARAIELARQIDALVEVGHRNYAELLHEGEKQVTVGYDMIGARKIGQGCEVPITVFRSHITLAEFLTTPPVTDDLLVLFAHTVVLPLGTKEVCVVHYEAIGRGLDEFLAIAQEAAAVYKSDEALCGVYESVLEGVQELAALLVIPYRLMRQSPERTRLPLQSTMKLVGALELAMEQYAHDIKNEPILLHLTWAARRAKVTLSMDLKGREYGTLGGAKQDAHQFTYAGAKSEIKALPEGS